MIEEAAVYHAVMIKIFLALLVINLLIPSMFKSSRGREIKGTRISYFLFSALLAMVAFTGIILYMLMDSPWNLGLTAMVVVFLLLSAIEIARSRRIRRAWMEGKSAASLSWRYVALEIVLMLAMMLFFAMDKKDAVPL
jgi:hypothetical protein